jgi:hypothetical protein
MSPSYFEQGIPKKEDGDRVGSGTSQTTPSSGPFDLINGDARHGFPLQGGGQNRDLQEGLAVIGSYSIGDPSQRRTQDEKMD